MSAVVAANAPRIVAALGWAHSNDADTRDILHDCPPLELAHGVLQASARRTHWIVALSASHISSQRIDTSAGGDIALRILRLPPHLSRRTA